MKTKRDFLRFNVDIVDHCNLNCKCCGHFSPLAKKSFLSIESFTKDCRRIAELTNGKIERLELMGGEPLLHPNIVDFIKIARSLFEGDVNIVTNGILLNSQSSNFFKACTQNQVTIYVTSYPIKLDFDLINEKSMKFQTKVVFADSNSNSSRSWYKNHRDLNGLQNINQNFNDCKWGNSCIILEEGKLTTCAMPFKSQHFNNYFRESFILTKDDYIDIYKCNSIDEILYFLSKPIPFCRYCLPNREEQIKWEQSSININEWF